MPNIIDFFLFPIARGINNTSGGIGKNIASIKEIKDNIFGPDGLSEKDKIQE